MDLSNKQLILDSHKLAWHFDRVSAWEAGERIAPVGVDMALTRACGAMCKFCYAMMQESQSRHSIKDHHVLNLLDDFREIGVRSVSLVSDGESTLSPHYVRFIQHAKSIGLDVANGTNGWEFEPEKSEQVLPHLTWVRFTVGAGTPSGYARVMYRGEEHVQVFERAIRNIKHAIDFKRKHDLDVTLGIQMVLMPELRDEIIPFARLGVELGADYAVIKHCSDDEESSLGIDYAQYNSMTPLLREAESLSNDRTKVIVKWSKIEDGNKTPYQRLYGPQFLLQISGSGLVAPSGMFFNAKHSKFHIGNFTEQRFINIWRSDQYWRVMRYLESKQFDARTMMGALPIQHYINVALDKHARGIQQLVKSNQPPPPHVNFL
jgi:MoaA/NifB/PqqE/SkfB family radical SAM enzyme